jgi:hypothetical protein
MGISALAGDAMFGHLRPRRDSGSFRFSIQRSCNVIGRGAQRKVRTDGVVVEGASEAEIQCAFLGEGMHRT